MREVNFSIPNVNKASVNITTTLYDRRALDCTSTLPLVNSLNHLAYLTTSSARIRDILTIDGGVERLVCILKEGRTKDLMDCWKWSLAFQCVVNIGVRGSESVRTRVVEADIVPVVATVLDNYIKMIEKARARAESESSRHSSRNPLKAIHGPTASLPTRPLYVDQSTNTEHRPSRRQAPPPHIEIPPHYQANNTDTNAMDIASSPRAPMATLPERRSLAIEDNPRHAHNAHRHLVMQPLSTAAAMDTADGFGLRPVRDAERLPSMLPGLQNGLISQPDSPTTPSGPTQLRSHIHPHGLRSRPTLLQQQSVSGDSDIANGEESTVGSTVGSGHSSAMGDEVGSEITDPMIGMENRMEIDDVGDRQSVLGEVSNAHDLTVNDSSEGQEADTFNIAHRSAVDRSMIENNEAQTNGLSPTQAPENANSPVPVPTPYSSYIRERLANQTTATTMPRDEDVLMALQLLAYVSKYCSLRSYFQNTHFVPKLRVDRELKVLDGGMSPIEPLDDEDEEYLQPDDVNIFPLVEHFTIRHHSKDMQYWACVVMRNLCRKDEAQGGIRQCAYWKCGKWEEYQRQFAKCRRCRRTKYCSKDCQKAAWISHRHWCHTNP